MAFDNIYVKGATSVIMQVMLRDSTTGMGKTGLVYNTAGLTAYYCRNNSTAQAMTLVDMTLGTWTSLGFKEVDATNMPGLYQFGCPDAALVTGANSVEFAFKGTGVLSKSTKIVLIDANLRDAVRLALTALPNASAEAAGGLYTRGTGAGQINQAANGQIDINAVKIAGAAVDTSAAQIGVNVVTYKGTAQTAGKDVSNIVDSRLPAALTVNGNMKSSLMEILATALAETAGYIAAGFKKFFNVSATPVNTMDSIALEASVQDVVAVTDSFTFGDTGVNAEVVHMNNDVITTLSIDDGAITADKIASDAITAAKIASDAITSAKIASNTIEAAKIKDGAFTDMKFAAGAFDAVWGVAVRTLTAATNISGMAVNLTQILGATITGTAASLVASFTKFFNIAVPTGTVNSLPDAIPGASGGLPTTNGTKVSQTVDLTSGQTIAATIAAGAIAANAIDAASIKTDAIETAKIKDGALTKAKFASDVFTVVHAPIRTVSANAEYCNEVYDGDNSIFTFDTAAGSLEISIFGGKGFLKLRKVNAANSLTIHIYDFCGFIEVTAEQNPIDIDVLSLVGSVHHSTGASNSGTLMLRGGIGSVIEEVGSTWSSKTIAGFASFTGANVNANSQVTAAPTDMALNSTVAKETTLSTGVEDILLAIDGITASMAQPGDKMDLIDELRNISGSSGFERETDSLEALGFNVYGAMVAAGEAMDASQYAADNTDAIISTLDSTIAKEATLSLLTQDKTVFVNNARPDDTGDGLSYATAKKTYLAAKNLFATGDRGKIYLVGGAGYAENLTIPDDVEVTSFKELAYIDGLWVEGGITPVVTMGKRSILRNVRIRNGAYDHDLAEVIKMASDAKVIDVSGYFWCINAHIVDMFINMNGSVSSNMTIKNCFYSGGAQTMNHAIGGMSGGSVFEIETNNFDGFADDVIDTSGGGFGRIFQNQVFNVQTDMYAIRVSKAGGNYVSENSFNGDGDFIYEAGAGTSTPNIIINNGDIDVDILTPSHGAGAWDGMPTSITVDAFAGDALTTINEILGDLSGIEESIRKVGACKRVINAAGTQVLWYDKNDVLVATVNRSGAGPYTWTPTWA